MENNFFDDPIVADVRKAGEKIAAEHGNDIHKLFEHWRLLEKQHPERVVVNTHHVEHSTGTH